MASKPVKFLTDLSTKKQIFKTDLSGNVVFDISGSSELNGYVSSSYPITGAAGFYGNLYGSASYAHQAYTYTSGAISGSGLPSNPVLLKDPLVINGITASAVQITDTLIAPNITGNLFGTASYAQYAANAADVAIGDELYNVYSRLKFQQVDYFDIDGSKIIVLPLESSGKPRFPTASLDYLNVNVQVKEDNRWVNDILSHQLYVSGANIVVELSAPAMTNTNQYKLLVSNENPDDLLV
jgi:hypothetical protein